MLRFDLVLTCAAMLLLIGCTRPQPATERSAEGPAPLTSLLGRPLYPLPAGAQRDEQLAKLAEARRTSEAHPNDPDALIWVGRHLGYLWRINEAIAVYSDGLQKFPDNPALWRHRGHRLISARRFAEAQRDLEVGARLLGNQPDTIEQDGMPNAQNIPLTTTGYNLWYHLALSRYLQGDFAGAAAGFRTTLEYTRGHDDNLVAASDWLYMSLRRLGDRSAADAVLGPIHPGMNIIENHAYHRRLLVYKGLESADDLWSRAESDLDRATLGYGLGNWFLVEGRPERAREVFEQIVEGPYWPAFGFIAAEVELARFKVDGSF